MAGELSLGGDTEGGYREIEDGVFFGLYFGVGGYRFKHGGFCSRHFGRYFCF